jgi:hypothetical protein
MLAQLGGMAVALVVARVLLASDRSELSSP